MPLGKRRNPALFTEKPLRILISKTEQRRRPYPARGCENGFVVDVAENGVERRHLGCLPITPVVAQVMLPAGGWTVLRDWERKQTPVLFLTARTASRQGEGLELARDDYLVNPSDSRSCWARALVFASRGKARASASRGRSGDRPASRRVSRATRKSTSRQGVRALAACAQLRQSCRAR